MKMREPAIYTKEQAAAAVRKACFYLTLEELQENINRALEVMDMNVIVINPAEVQPQQGE